MLYAKQLWGTFAQALAEADKGDGSAIRAIVDEDFYLRNPNGTYDPLTDRYFTIGASEQEYPRDHLQLYLKRGAESWASFRHFWVNSGYVEINYALWPAHDEDAYGGPFRIPATSPTALVIATTYDPATPYPGAQRLVRELGNARLLTMDGDGHTAYGRNSTCIDHSTEAYLVSLTLPAKGTVCRQEVPFTAPKQVPAGAGTSTLTRVTSHPVLAGR